MHYSIVTCCQAARHNHKATLTTGVGYMQPTKFNGDILDVTEIYLEKNLNHSVVECSSRDFLSVQSTGKNETTITQLFTNH